MKSNIQIALPTKLGRNLTYSIDSHYNPKDLIGCRALVKLQNRVLTGFIVGTDSEISGFEIKPILKLIDSEPIFNQQLIELAKWISDYYLSDLGIVLKSMLPPELSSKKTLIIRPKKDLNFMDLNSFRKNTKKYKIIEYLIDNKRQISLGSLENKLSIKDAKQSVEELHEKDFIELIDKLELEDPFKFEKYVKIDENIFLNHNSDEIIQQLKIRSKYQKNIIEFYSINQDQISKELHINQLIERSGSSRDAIKKLSEKSVLEIIPKRVDRSLPIDRELFNRENELEFEPNKQQMLSIEKICDTFFENNFSPFLLHGVTGSGKTLVYLRSIQECIESDKTVLIIVPEISLSNQLINRFEKAFPGEVFTYHSMMSPGARKDTFENVRSGRAKILIGTRSSVFAPLKNLGLIIVDEEHDRSFKQDMPNPKYNARDVAVVRASIEKCTVVLGSATPSIESFKNAIDGKYELLELTERADGAGLPKVKVIDILDAKKNAQSKGIFTNDLLSAIENRVAKAEQSILFINRRGHSSFMECTNCGNIPMCKRCDVALTYHKHKNKLYCHYCGWNEHANRKCKECTADEMKLIGTGTQKVEEEILKHAEESGIEIKVKRVDSDTIKNQKKLNKILNDFSEGNFDVLVGTQMITKGLDFKKVTLVGIINADLELYQPDFRATERTFQLLEQVAGRAGRSKDFKGEVIIQTNKADNFALKYVRNHDYRSFFNDELSNRESSFWPPFARYASISISSKNERLCEDIAELIYSLLNFDPKVMTVHEPTFPSVERLRGQHRRLIALKSDRLIDKSGSYLRKVVSRAIENADLNSIRGDLRVSVDIDSYSGF